MVLTMTRAQSILFTLIAYKLVLVIIGLWASSRTRNATDFFIGGHRLGAIVAAISASASSSSAWTLLGVSGAAYVWGLSALWLFPATLLGFFVNWLLVAPRLRKIARTENAITLTELISGERTHRLYPLIAKTAAVMILFSFTFYVAAQFQAAGGAFASSFGLSMNTSILIGGGVILIYTLLGGFWAVSVTDTLQGLLMAFAACFLPWVALLAVGGFGQLVVGLNAVATPAQSSLTGEFHGVMGLAFILGTLGIGLGYPGQPHVVNRFMALRDQSAVERGRVIAICWAMVIYAGMILLGLCARVLFSTISDHEQVLFEVANRLLSPVIAGVMVAAVLSAIMSTADSQLLVAASAASQDWNLPAKPPRNSLVLPRLVVLGLSILAITVALFAPEAIFSRVLFAWHALGSAFGPLVLLRVLGIRVSAAAILASMCAGFGLTVVFHFFPDAPGDVVERVVPFFVALFIALAGRERQ